MTPAGRSTTCVTHPRQRPFGAGLGPARKEKFFLLPSALLDALQVKEEWIGRTETKQFQFVTCVPAPLRGASCASGPGATRTKRSRDVLRARDETAEKIGSSLREVDWFCGSCRKNETPVSYFRAQAVNFPQRFACFPPDWSCLPVDIKQLVRGHSDPVMRHVF